MTDLEAWIGGAIIWAFFLVGYFFGWMRGRSKPTWRGY